MGTIVTILSTGGAEAIATLEKLAAAGDAAYRALTADWFAWMQDAFWWKLAASGDPRLCAATMQLVEESAAAGMDPVAWNRLRYGIVEHPLTGPVPSLPPFAWTIDDGESVRLVLAECFRCGHTVFTDEEIGTPCQQEGCVGRYVKG